MEAYSIYSNIRWVSNRRLLALKIGEIRPKTNKRDNFNARFKSEIFGFTAFFAFWAYSIFFVEREWGSGTFVF